MLMRIMVVLSVLLIAVPTYAEMKIFEKEVEEIVANDQSREQVEAFALQKAKRLAVEEAGTYISSLTVVINSVLKKDEITALASGVVQVKIIGLPAVRLENGVVHVNVRARIQVDTSILDKQVAEILKEKSTLKNLENEQQKVRELEQKLAKLKSSELKRLEELNSQAIALEQERDRRRLANAELALSAQGELKNAEIERLRQEREMQERTARMIAEQEQQRKSEADAIAMEQDRIRRAQLENEQRWNDLSRKSQLAQSQWVVIDDSLSLKQALEEAGTIRKEIAIIKQRSELQYGESVKTMKSAYEQQIAVTIPSLPPPLAVKDPFETTAEYNSRRAIYGDKVTAANVDNAKKIEKLKYEEALKLSQVKLAYLQQQIKVLKPFVERLAALQTRQFVLPSEPVTVELGEPDADRSCFPTIITCKSKRWTVDWPYTDRNKARDLYKTRTFLKAEAMVQLDNISPDGYVMTATRITHPGSGDHQTLLVAKPAVLAEIASFQSAMNGSLAEAEKDVSTAAIYAEYGNPGSGIGMDFVFVPGGCFQMGSSSGKKDENPLHEVCLSAFFIGKFEVTQAQWQTVMGSNPSRFSDCKDCPVESVSWEDAQEFIRRLNSNPGWRYRLPTEAEWEYAARSGGKAATYTGTNNESELGKYAWYDKNAGGGTHPVGQRKPNNLGLYDMSGNVREWVNDWYNEDYYKNSLKDNPSDPPYSSSKVTRGGAWDDEADHARCARRDSIAPAVRISGVGFRVSVSTQ